MILQFTVAGLVWLALTAYGVLGGADFGGGIWDLFSYGKLAERQRSAIINALGPVWEANNVWLIFAIVLTFTGFPTVFSALSQALFIPLTIALLGITLRGAAFVFRNYTPRSNFQYELWGRTFSAASIITPFMFGVSAGAIVGGNIRFSNGITTANYFTTWITPFASVGVGIPLFLLITEGLWLRTGEEDWMILTKRWTKYFGVLFPIGAVSGTILSFELGLLWPTFMQFSGDIIGLPFALEGFAFFIEAIFLGLYIYGWKRLTPLQHWLTSIPLALSGAASSWFVVSANAWMNSPSGFEYKNGVLTGINPVEAIFNPSTPTETIHMLLAAYEVTAFGMAMMFAISLLRGRRESWVKKGLMVAMLMGTIVAPLQIISGDASARAVAQLQPAKLAAMEALYHTTAGAPLTIGGIPNNATQTTSYAIEIPKGLSFLVSWNFNTTVPGLDSFPEPMRPNPALVHPFFVSNIP